ncbi:histidine phosphatase family protein [Frigidibacter sp. ROC022]|uniref:histidine phosphatase family protein n=1 Tax=Frigidibacter sp. ROC022 TaxID=2971796 RepID=UPI00215B1CBD|nr:histidine phosphatase family protein [Frigidibacter sp. ROC022]MCR8723898.1 histidine phosphatase family protein [Frigidibacter sp. ROC022]
MNGQANIFEIGFSFLRHGESEANRSGLIAGSLDVPLTDRGRDQARSAAPALAGEGITRILASPMARAHETAEIVARELGLPVEPLPGIEERGFGQLEGRPLDDRPDYFADPPGGESWETFRRRCESTLERINGSGNLIVGHAGTWRAICARIGLRPEENAIPNATPIRVAPLGMIPAWSSLPPT